MRVNYGEVEIASRAGVALGLHDGIGERGGSLLEVGTFLLVGLGDSEQNAAKTRAAHAVFRRKVGAAEKRSAIGEEESREGPAPLAGNGADRGLVAGIHIGPLVAIDFNRDEMFVNDFGDGGIFVAFAVDDVAPVAPDGADIEEDGLVLLARLLEGGIAPLVPVDRLMGGGAEIRAGGIREAI